MANNLRVLSNNIAGTASITSSNVTIAAFPISNIMDSNKGKVFRVDGDSTNIKMSWGSNQTLSCVGIPTSNITSNALIRVRVYSDAAFTALLSDTGSISITNARVYLTRRTNVRSLQIDITDATLSYIEVANIVCGDYWSPVYNTDFGVEISQVSTSVHTRTQSGNISSDIGTISKVLTLPLNWLTEVDNIVLLKILKSNPLVFISVFPEDSDTIKEAAYQIYGKIANLATITNSVYNMYSSSLVVEEI